MGSNFFSGLFTGNSPGLSAAAGNAGNILGFGTNLGENDISAGSNFYNTLLSGDPTAIGRILGPQLSDIQQQGQQQIQTAAEFGNRSGGTNAAAQTNIDSQRQNAQQLISQLTGQAAGAVTNIGENALNTGLSATGLEGELAQQELQNQQNSILGGIFGGLGGLAGKGIAGGLGMIPGLGEVI